MSDVLLKGTGRLGLEKTLVSWRDWLADRSTGWEVLGTIWTTTKMKVTVPNPGATVDVIPVIDAHWPLVGARAPNAEATLASRAAALAAETPYAVSPVPPAPQLTGNLAEDVHAICGLTWAEIAEVFKISERAAAGWRTQGVPLHRAQTMEALRAIGAALVGGLGPEGVSAWLTAGDPSRLERLRDGEQAAIAEEALSYRDTPAS